MKTSFYFVLWIVIYPLIYLTGSPILIENSFFVALILVFGLSAVLNKLLRNQIGYAMMRSQLSLFEIFYRDDYKAYVSIFKRAVVKDVVSLVYLTLAVVMLVLLHAGIFECGIFALFAFSVASMLSRHYKAYKAAVAQGGLLMPDDPQAREAIEQYVARRATTPLSEMYPKPSGRDKALRIANIVFSVVAIILGLFMGFEGLAGILSPSGMFGDAISVCYGSLAVYFGVTDLISLAQGYSDIPV